MDNHWGRILSGALLTSLFAAGIQLSQGTNSSVLQTQSVGQQIGQSVGQQVGQLGTEVTRRNLNVQPTLVVRPGYRFFVRVEKDILLTDLLADDGGGRIRAQSRKGSHWRSRRPKKKLGRSTARGSGGRKTAPE